MDDLGLWRMGAEGLRPAAAARGFCSVRRIFRGGAEEAAPAGIRDGREAMILNRVGWIGELDQQFHTSSWILAEGQGQRLRQRFRVIPGGTRRMLERSEDFVPSGKPVGRAQTGGYPEPAKPGKEGVRS